MPGLTRILKKLSKRFTEKFSLWSLGKEISKMESTIKTFWAIIVLNSLPSNRGWEHYLAKKYESLLVSYVSNLIKAL